ncbi:sigma-54-dependent Fis family transcriptional regulator [candidate division WOR-3 bacterium]|nr:sigma-54-dependent Fis family transcriptional regulator [candidate division WOR-3 bacterium]
MKILLVDDERRFCEMTAENLRELGYEVKPVFSGEEAVRVLEQERFDVVITDLKMVPVDGMAVLAKAKQVNPEGDVVVITGYGTIALAVAAMKQGAFDFITKPVALDHLQAVLEKIREHQKTRDENRQLKEELKLTSRFAELVGDSPAIAKVKGLIAKVAQSDATVLITGESGTGKELVARMIHRLSNRAQNPFVVMHAAALPETLLESELFGYEKGAFTGATSRKSGRLEQAQGGTLFLDEVGEITASLQVKLLRFLQDRSFVRLGGRETITVDARIVAATNRNLPEEVRAGRFREDLYYRLAVFPIHLPPLREHKEDIPALARHILSRLGYQKELSEDVVKTLLSYDWPGNVRELENVLERALILSEKGEIKPQFIQFPEPVFARKSDSDSPGSLWEMERKMVEEALARAGGNKSKAAKLLGITRRMLYTKLAKFGIETQDGE